MVFKGLITGLGIFKPGRIKEGGSFTHACLFLMMPAHHSPDAEFSAVLGNNAKCVGDVLWDTKGPDPEFTPESPEPDKEI